MNQSWPVSRAEHILSPARVPGGIEKGRRGVVASPRRATGGRVLVGGVGYGNLRDLSAGPLLMQRLGTLGDGVDVEDLSYSPIDVLFALERRDPYARVVLVGAVARGDPPGTVRRQRWAAPPIAPEDLQTRIAEAVTGVISLDNHLYVLTHFGALPEEVVVIEIEPEDQGWGEGTSEVVRAAMERAAALVRAEVAEAGSGTPGGEATRA